LSYPFTLILLLALGFCLNYKESVKEKQKKTLFIVMGLTILTMLPRTDNFYVLDHNSPFWVREPGIYKLIGSISVLSIFPPLIYAASSVIEYLNGYMRTTSMRVRIKGIGITMVHIAVVLIIIGAVVSSTRTTSIDRINIPIGAQGQLLDVGNGYGIRVVELSSRSLTDNSSAGADSGNYNVQSVKLEIYQGNNKIGSGTAKYLQGKGGSGTYPMVSPSLGLFAGDVYVIFQGTGGGAIPLTLRIIPAVDLAWIGIILFAFGIILIMLVKSKARGS
jgi:cytochrome c-type biogenesis protein CcmF